jgi:hypothetical protein
MSRNKTILAVLMVCLSFNLIPLSYTAAKTEIKTPTIIEVVQTGNYLVKPLIKGLTSANTEVLGYIDGSFFGLAKVESEGTGSDNFSLAVNYQLKSGQHHFVAVARDKTSLVLSAPSPEIIINITGIPAPTLIQPDADTITGKVKPIIAGLTVSGSFVHIFIDGTYNGKTDLLEHPSGTANFIYKPFLNLAIGDHTLTAVAEDKLGQTSIKSDIIHFRVLSPTPAPSLLDIKNNVKVSNKPIITGLAKNSSLIKVFIDKKLNGQFVVKNNISGTANFAYIPYVGLTKGRHFVYTVAYDSVGKESRWSNIKYFIIGDVLIPEITPVAVEEKSNITATPAPLATEKNNEAEPEEKTAPAEELSGKTEEAKSEISDDQDIQKIINAPLNATTASGIINESRKLQSQLNLNLIVFILFLIAVIGWIFWVNRELIKEKQEQETKAKKE